MMNHLPISVVIPTFNRQHVIERCIRSIHEQRVAPAEILVSDDASTDQTVTLARRLGATVLAHEHNRGSGPTRNAGIAAASQPWIAFLDSDDEWRPGHLEALWPHTERYDFLATTAQETHGHTLGRLRGCGTETAIELTSPEQLVLPENRVVTSTTLVRKSLIETAGGFRDFRRAQDLDLWLRCIELGPGVILPDVTIRYHLGDDQASNDIELMRSNVIRILESQQAARWNTAGLHVRARTQDRWDSLRRAQREGNPLQVIMHASWFMRHPTALPTLRHLLAHRKNIRTRTSQLLQVLTNEQHAATLQVTKGLS